MNFLAHFLIAARTPSQRPGESPGGVVGGFAADFVKGRGALAALPEDVRAGVGLHRRVDALTDFHPLVVRSKARLGEAGGRYAGIIVDVVYDYCLARQWPRHARPPLPAFIAESYAVLADNGRCLPPEARRCIDRMIADDWLGSYATLNGIALALSRLSLRLTQRFARPVSLEAAVDVLRRDEAGFLADFADFFPQLREQAAGTGEGPAGALEVGRPA